MDAPHQYTQMAGHVMWQILWEFRVAPEHRSEFERIYGTDGAWAQLFARATDFRGTTLLRDPHVNGRYVTVDLWATSDAFENFKREHAPEYKALDDQCETLTEYEMKIGGFDQVGRRE